VAPALGDASVAPMRRLAVSTGLTSMGKWGFAITVSVYAFDHGGAKTVGLVALAQALPAMALAPFLALVWERRARRDILLAANLARAGVLVGAALAAASGEPPVVVFALAVVYSVVSTTNQPARAALLISLAQTPRQLSAGNALLGIADTAGFVAGSGLGGLMLAAASPQAVTGACSAAYLVAVGVIAGIPADARRRRSRGQGPLTAILGAARALGGDGGLRAAFGLIGALALSSGLTNVLVVVVAIDRLDIGPAGVGELNTAFGLGGILAGPMMLALLRRSVPTLGGPIGALLAGVPLIALAAATQHAVAIAAWAVVGLGAALTRSTALTLSLRLASDRMLAGILGLLEMVIIAGTGIGAVLAPLVLHLLGAGGALVVTGALLPVVAASVWLPLRRRELDGRVATADFRLLRADPIFAPLSIATIEALAAQLGRRHASAGETIIAQGEHGDAYFLVERGAVEVLVDGEARRRLGPGGSFGEIALLRDLPRTATVRALEPTELRVVGRERFLLAVTGEPESHDMARDVADRLLAGAPAPG
jgi:predicted MFS family arabinose efflux permease